MESLLRFRIKLGGTQIRSAAVVTAIAATSLVNADTLTWPYKNGSSVSYTPQVFSTTNFTQVETGLSHAVALSSNGKIYTWGANNDRSQLGRSGAANSPTQVTGFQDASGHSISAPVITKVAASNNAGFAIDNKKNLYYWGTIEGSPVKSKPTRLAFVGGDVYDIAAGGEHGLIYGKWLLWKGVWSFGSNVDGESALFPCVNKWSIWLPANITGAVAGCDNINVVSMAAGASHSAILLNDGRLRVFGKNNKGQLGVGHTHPLTGAPYFTLVATAKTLTNGNVGGTQVVAGNDFTLVRTSAGKVLSAGNNAFGVLNRTGDTTKFGQASGLSGVTALSAGRNAALAKVSLGVAQWGFAPTSNTTSAVLAPTLVPGVSSASVLEASNASYPTNGPFNAYFNAPGSGHVLSGASLVAPPVEEEPPVFDHTAVLYQDSVRPGNDLTGGTSGVIRVYADKVAEDGNGPTFTLSTSSSSIIFGGSATVPDGQDFVDISVDTSPVVGVENATYSVASTTNPTVNNLPLTIHNSYVSSLSVANVTNPGNPFKGGQTVRISVTLAQPAPAEGYDAFVSTSNSVIPGGFVHVNGGSSTGTLDVTVNRVENYDEVEFAVMNPDFEEFYDYAEVYIAELVSISTLNNTQGGGGSGNAGNKATLVFDSLPPTAGIPVDLSSSDASIVDFLESTVYVTTQTFDVDLVTSPVSSSQTVTLTASANFVDVTVNKTLVP